ncbi:hypothetical protein L1987_78681 [Smallanthus sonchifolius]|uniref:Uncharacterized protein n=1 Tax=Smallanthus sonchifolius TaxID=185202 RepID=A0ACB8ZDK8_9ASTR|nr:hypothetical protein L1987_78681 [Smallanthus sonchifolius]
MDPEEPCYMAWERFNTLLSKCPKHGLSDWALVEKFYNGLTFEKQPMFNTAAGCHIMDKKEPEECEEIMVAALASMAKEIKELKMSAMKCEMCRGSHDTIDFPLVRTDQETQGKLKEHDTLLRSQQSAFLDLQRTVGDIARQLTDRS